MAPRKMEGERCLDTASSTCVLNWWGLQTKATINLQSEESKEVEGLSALTSLIGNLSVAPRRSKWLFVMKPYPGKAARLCVGPFPGTYINCEKPYEFVEVNRYVSRGTR